MKHRKLPTLTFTLKVNIKCCQDCQEKVMKRLKKMDGLDSVRYDSEKGMLTVSGNTDPAILINKFDKWGRKAELYSFQKYQIDNRGKCRNCCASKTKNKALKMREFDCSSGSEDENKEESPDLIQNSPKEESLMKMHSAKKGKKFFGWFGKKDKATKASSNKNGGEKVREKSLAASKWHFPRMSMTEYGAPVPFVPPPYGDQRLYHMNLYPPMMYPRAMRPYYGYGVMPPFGFFQPRPPARMNPMIHYTSYQDNSLCCP